MTAKRSERRIPCPRCFQAVTEITTPRGFPAEARAAVARRACSACRAAPKERCLGQDSEEDWRNVHACRVAGVSKEMTVREYGGGGESLMQRFLQQVVRDVRCSVCGAAAGQRCPSDDAEAPLRDTHANRVQRYRERVEGARG